MRLRLVHTRAHSHPSKALWEEHQKLFLNADGTWKDVTYESTKEMPLMDSVIRETLRMVSAQLKELSRFIAHDGSS